MSKITKGYHLPVTLVQEFEEEVAIKKENGELSSSTSHSAVVEMLIRQWVAKQQG